MNMTMTIDSHAISLTEPKLFDVVECFNYNGYARKATYHLVIGVSPQTEEHINVELLQLNVSHIWLFRIIQLWAVKMVFKNLK